MEEKVRLIVWNTSALDHFAGELEGIAQSSYTRAEQVEQAVLTKLQQAAHMPERHAKTNIKETIQDITGPLRPMIIVYPIVMMSNKSGSCVSGTFGKNPSIIELICYSPRKSPTKATCKFFSVIF